MDIGSSGLVVGGGVFAFLIATFSVALKLLLMADQKDDVNYERLTSLLRACEDEREQGRTRARAREAEVRSQFEAEIERLRVEVDLWRDRYIQERGDSS